MSETDHGIRALDDDTIDQIAAGEVVERPASVVKELIENALDAGASRIAVEVEAGGTDRIRVADDGIGMTEAAVRRAVEAHTTSKLRDIEDLTSGIETLGFRGEALHTIGAVARMRIATRPQRHDGAGTKLTMVGGSIESVEPVGCPPGTAVEVSDLFFNTPARRKFLKQEPTEFDHVNRIVTQYALANPDVAMRLEHDDRTVFHTTGGGDLEDAVLSVYGRDVAEAMLPLDGIETADGPARVISGAVSDPETTRSASRYVSTYVNGRYVRSRVLREAIVSAYGHQLAADRFPFAVVFLELPPSSIDINVHPRKLEVRFDEEAAVRRQLRRTVEPRLRTAGILRSSAARGRSAPTETSIEPEPPVSRSGDGEEPPSTEARGVPPRADCPPSGSAQGPSRAATTTRRVGGGSATEQRRLGSPPITTFDRLPDIDVLGQVSETYIVGEHEEGLVLIDQHAADERIQFERLRERFRDGVTTQTLVDPVTVEITAAEGAIFEAMTEALAHLGFTATRSGSSLELRTVPAVLGDSLDPSILQDVLEAFVAGDPRETVEAAAEAILADLACYPAVTGNTSLTEGSVTALLESLDECDEPRFCPHGRPTVIAIPWEEVEDRFERDYPGHATRQSE